jgi:replicative DNA helicase
MANDLELCVIVLLQPQKMAGTPSDPLTSYRQVKGASLIEQDCRVIISLWREGYSSDYFDHDKFITFAILKNTMGELGKVDCGWDGKTGKIYALEDIERAELKELRALKKLEQSGDDF